MNGDHSDEDDEANPRPNLRTDAFEKRKKSDWPQFLAEMQIDRMSWRSRKDFLVNLDWLEAHMAMWKSGELTKLLDKIQKFMEQCEELEFDENLIWLAAYRERLKTEAADKAKADDDRRTEEAARDRRLTIRISIIGLIFATIIGLAGFLENALTSKTIILQNPNGSTQVLQTAPPDTTPTAAVGNNG